MTYYSTVTSKGQITLPAKIRKNMKLQTGQKVSINLEDNGKINIEVPFSIDEIRAKLRANLKKQGFTPNKLRKMAEEYKNGDGFATYVEKKYGTHR